MINAFEFWGVFLANSRCMNFQGNFQGHPNLPLWFVQEMCKEIYKNLSADDFLLQLFQRFGVQFTAELLLMLQAPFCPSLRHSHQLVRLSRFIFKETHFENPRRPSSGQSLITPTMFYAIPCVSSLDLYKSNKYVRIAQKDCAKYWSRFILPRED